MIPIWRLGQTVSNDCSDVGPINPTWMLMLRRYSDCESSPLFMLAEARGAPVFGTGALCPPCAGSGAAAAAT